MIERSCCIVPDISSGNGDDSNRYLPGWGAGRGPGVSCNPRGKQTAKEILPKVVENADLPDDVKKRSGKSWKEYEYSSS